MSNPLGSINSELLRTYAALDPRVVPLLLTIKHWVKMKGIGDASQGYMSSYCWVYLLRPHNREMQPV